MIIKGKQKKPFAIIVAGQPGTGMTTFASHAPDPIFIPTEVTDEADVDRFPIAKSYQELISNLKSPEVKNYKTVVIDAIDGVETLMHRYLLENDPKKAKTANSAYGGYGQFYNEAQKLFEEDIKSTLSDLRENHGLHVIITAHTYKKLEVDPIAGISYDTVQLNLHQKAQSVLVDWVSAVMFASHVSVKAETEGKGSFAVGTGERVLYTESRPGFVVAKNRYNLPFEMPLDFNAFFDAYNDFYLNKKRSIDEILTGINGLLLSVSDEELLAKVNEAIKASNNDLDKLLRIEEKLKIRVRG